MTLQMDSVMSSYSDSEDYIRFESVEHGKSVLAGIQNLREMQQLFDVTLVAGGREFPAHRVVLASCSDYFRAMFTDGLRECSESRINLIGLTASGMEHLINFAYNSTINIDAALDNHKMKKIKTCTICEKRDSNMQYQHNVFDVLSGATHVQILPVIKACENYLIRHLTLDNCISAANVAELYSLKNLQLHVLNFMCQNWAAFSVDGDFYELTPQFLIMLLSCGYPVNCKEIDVFVSILKWFSYSPAGRVAHMTSILRCIIFDNISWAEFTSATNSKEWAELSDTCPMLLDSLPTLSKLSRYKLLEEDTIINVTNYSPAIKSSVSVTRIEVRQQSFIPTSMCRVPGLINSRGFHSAIIVAGGFSKESGMTNNVLYLDGCTGSLKHLTKIPHIDQINFGVAVYQNQLFVVGGCFNDHMQEIAHPFGFCYTPTSDKWMSIAPMLQERCRFLLCASDDRIYAIGGDPCASDMSPEDVAPCEVYNPKLNKWKSVSPLPGNRSQLAGTSLGRCVLVSGGILECEEKVFQDFYQYDPRTDVWERRANMLTPRTDHSMFVWEEQVYVIGGWHLDPVTKRRIMATTIDCYNFSTDSWEEIGSLNTVRTYGTYSLNKDSIYAIGGWCDGDLAQKCYTIDTFNLRFRTWVQGREQKTALWEHCSCSLYLPKIVSSHK